MGPSKDDVRARLTSRLAHAVLEGSIAGRLVADPNDHAERIAANTAWAEGAEQELAEFLEPYLKDIHEALPDDNPLKEIIGQMRAPNHQVGLLIQIVGALPAIAGIISGLAKVASQPTLNYLWSQMPNIPLSPADAADMVERNIMSQADGRAVAAFSGLAPGDFDLLVEDTGEPPGIQESLALLLRGAMTEAEFTRILYYSRVRNEFLPYVLQMAYHQMSPADAIELGLKQVVSQDEARAAFVRGGGVESEFDNLLAAAGNPIGVQQAANLYAHGLITKDRFYQVVAHSRMNPEFADLALLTHEKWLAPYQIEQALKSGQVDAKTAAEWMQEDGYDAAQSAAFAGGSASGKTVSHKAETEAMIVAEYSARLITEAQATTMLSALGYDQTEIGLILALQSAKVIISQRNSAIGKIRALYVNKRISKETAQGDLDALQIPTAARDQFLEFWQMEQGAKVEAFTTAQIGGFLKYGVLPMGDAVARWVALGWGENDAQLLGAYYSSTAASRKAAQGIQ